MCMQRGMDLHAPVPRRLTTEIFYGAFAGKGGGGLEASAKLADGACSHHVANVFGDLNLKLYPSSCNDRLQIYHPESSIP